MQRVSRITIISAGAVTEGILYEFMGLGLTQVHTIDSLILAAGLAVVMYAIYTSE